MSGHPILPSDPITLPLLPLRDVVVFPHMVIPLFVGRPKSIKALEAAMEAGRQIMLVAQKAAGKDEPKAEDMFDVGCVSSILQMLKLPDGTVKVLVEGVQRANTSAIHDENEYFTADVVPVQPEGNLTPEVEALRRAVTQQFDQYVKLNKKIPPEILTSISGIDDAGRLADTIAAHLPLKLEAKQSVLDLFSVSARLEKLLEQLEHEVDILQVEKRIRGRVKRQMEKSQREYYLNEQVKAIQKELGEGEEGADLEELAKKVEAARMPKEARKKADAELKKLRLMSPMSAEATVVRNYIDTLVGLPWSKKSKVKHDLTFAEGVLNEEHYGLDKVKERILEYLAVQQRVDKVKAPILCLVGPPGVGKTSLGRSPVQPDASSCAWPWAACVTKLKSVATAALTSARCRARCCRAWARWVCAIHCSCLTRSTSWAWTSVATHRRRCWKCSTLSRTTPAVTITSRSSSTCLM
jgi:ATP-dependent Lon protease